MAVEKKIKPVPQPKIKTIAEQNAQKDLKDSLFFNKGSKEPMKRITLDIPKRLYTALKKDCAENELKMSDIFRNFLENKYK